jgi:hypothetical protein
MADNKARDHVQAELGKAAMESRGIDPAVAWKIKFDQYRIPASPSRLRTLNSLQKSKVGTAGQRDGRAGETGGVRGLPPPAPPRAVASAPSHLPRLPQWCCPPSLAVAQRNTHPGARFAEKDKADIDNKAQEWATWLKQHGYADSYLRVTIPNVRHACQGSSVLFLYKLIRKRSTQQKLYVKFELLETKPEEKEQKLTLQEVAHRFAHILKTRADVHEVHTLPLPSQTPDISGGLMSEKQIPHY